MRVSMSDNKKFNVVSDAVQDLASVDRILENGSKASGGEVISKLSEDVSKAYDKACAIQEKLSADLNHSNTLGYGSSSTEPRESEEGE